MSEEQYIARYSLVLTREPSGMRERRLIKGSLENLVENIIREDLGNEKFRVVARPNQTEYTFEQGMVYVNMKTDFPTLIVFEDTLQDWSSFAAGNITMHALGALGRAFRENIIPFYEEEGHKNPERIRNLAEVRIEGVSNGRTEKLSLSAIPLHYRNRRKIRSSSLAIDQAERYVRLMFGDNHNGKIEVETQTANVWEINHGILHGFSDQRSPETGPQLYRKRKIKIGGKGK